MKIKKITPLFVVDTIEPALPFWANLGFEKAVEVPHGDVLGFVILTGGDREVMLQTRASLKNDLPLGDLEPMCALYMDVDTLAGPGKAGRVLVADRKTAYGAQETWVVDPAGILVGFAIAPAG